MLLDCLLSPELCFRLPIYTVCCNRYADLQSFVNFAFCCSWDLPLLLLMQLVVFFANVAFLFSVANVDLLDVKLDIFVQKMPFEFSFYLKHLEALALSLTASCSMLFFTWPLFIAFQACEAECDEKNIKMMYLAASKEALMWKKRFVRRHVTSFQKSDFHFVITGVI